MRGLTKVRIQGRLGGTVHSLNRLRLEYNLSGDPDVSTFHAGWTVLADELGSAHSANVMFYTPELAVPAAAQVNNCLIRVGILGGDGVADPTITCCILNFYA